MCASQRLFRTPQSGEGFLCLQKSGGRSAKTPTLWRRFFKESPCPSRTERHSSQNRSSLSGPTRDIPRFSSMSKRCCAVERASLPSHGYYSNMFLVPKKNGEMRPIINLKSLNNAVEKGKFKMETQRAIRRALQKGDWVTTIDLKDAYFHIPIKPAFRKFLRFTVQEEVFQLKALPFGLTTALREFTRVTVTLASLIHRRGINLHLYLEDWLLRARSFEQCLQYTREVVQETTDLGFIINPEKSDLVPTQRFSFLDMRPMQLYLLSQWSMSTQPLSCKVFLNSFFQEHLSWWNSPENLLEGQLLHLPKETEELCTDSSKTWWGATLNTVHMVQGVWDQTTSNSKSINWLELKTVHLAILHFLLNSS